MTEALKINRATVEDLLAIPEELRRHEIIDGVLFEKEATGFKHGAVQVGVGRWLGPYDRRPGGRQPGGWWFASETESLLSTGDVVRPDVSGWRRERLPVQPDEWLVKIRPDWVCEILSTNRSHDLVRKKRAYHRAEIPHYWILDPVDGTLSVHQWSSGGYTEVLSAYRHERVHAEPFGEIELFVGVLFGDDPED